MRESEVKITMASDSELVVIEQLAKQLDLDMEDTSRRQFVVAKKEERIIGFGRLRSYHDCTEIATVGVIVGEQKKGVGSMLVWELIRLGPSEIYATCVIPDFFKKFGFQMEKQYPAILQKKVDFCKSYNYTDEQVFVMKLRKN